MTQKKNKQISIRIPNELHFSLELSANARDISLNELINQRLSGTFTQDELQDSFNFKHRFFELRDMVEYRSDLTHEMFKSVMQHLDAMDEQNKILTDRLEGALMDNYRLLTIIFNKLDAKK